MKKFDLLNRLVAAGVIAVIRSETAADAIKLTDAVIAGGVPALS